jgi:hypothetical protein
LEQQIGLRDIECQTRVIGMEGMFVDRDFFQLTFHHREGGESIGKSTSKDLGIEGC